MSNLFWHDKHPTLYAKLKSEMALAFPDLLPVEEKGPPKFRGTLRLVEEGKALDTYSLEVELPNDYPHSLPIIRETGGRIPRRPDRHINADGTLCVCLPDDYHFSGGSTRLVDFITGPVRSFFIGNSMIEAGGEWPWGEWEHREDGILAFYCNRFGTSDQATVLRYLEILGRRGLKGHWPCPCGSGCLLRNCCIQKLAPLRAHISSVIAKRAFSLLVGWKKL